MFECLFEHQIIVLIRFLLRFKDQTHMLVGWLLIVYHVSVRRMPGSPGKRSLNQFRPFTFGVIWIDVIVLFCHRVCLTFPQHKVFLRQFSTGEEKLQKRQPIKSHDESEWVWSSVKSSPGRLGQPWHRHISLMFALVPVSSSVQSLLLRQHLHHHPCLRGRLRPGANRGRGREAGLSGEPAAGQPQLGWRWGRRAAPSHVAGCRSLWCAAEIFDDASRVSYQKTASAAPW